MEILEQLYRAFYKATEGFAFEHIVGEECQVDQLANQFVLCGIVAEQVIFLTAQGSYLVFFAFEVVFLLSGYFVAFLVFVGFLPLGYFIVQRVDLAAQGRDFGIASRFGLGQDTLGQRVLRVDNEVVAVGHVLFRRWPRT